MHAQRYAKLKATLEQILDTLLTQYQPEKIILYGSMASGDIHEWSDLDLVIIKDTDLTFFKKLKQVTLLSPVWVGVDYLADTPDEFAQMVADKNPFIVEDVINKGQVLYE